MGYLGVTREELERSERLESDPVTLLELNDFVDDRVWDEGPPQTMAGREITLTANRSDEEPHRLVRLAVVVRYLEVYHKVVLRPLGCLHDHKGVLIATWLCVPSVGDKAAVVSAWGSQFENVVEHQDLDWNVFERCEL